jgi:hypothetical protein
MSQITKMNLKSPNNSTSFTPRLSLALVIVFLIMAAEIVLIYKSLSVQPIVRKPIDETPPKVKPTLVIEQFKDDIIPMEEKMESSVAFLKNKKFVIGIPTSYRQQNYLEQTLSSIISNTHPNVLKLIKIVILNCHIPATDNKNLEVIQNKYNSLIKRNIVVLESMEKTHWQLNQTLRQTWNDSMERVIWRSKQALDFAYLMEKGYDIADYFMLIEDDVIVSNNFIVEIIWWTEKYFGDESKWTLLSFYSSHDHKDKQIYALADFFGTIGQLYKKKDLLPISTYIKTNFNESPVDWLLRDYLIKAGAKVFSHKPDLFQHTGKVSTVIYI